MFKKIITYNIILGLILLATSVVAMPNPQMVENSHSGTTVTIPQTAVEASQNFYYLGQAIDPLSGKIVQGYAIIHYQDNYAKPPWAGGNKNNGSQCYTFLGNNTKWKNIEPWLVNPDNTSGLSNSFVFSNLTADIAKWEDAADGILNNGNSLEILGNGSSVTNNLTADFTAPDGQNEVYFADVSSPGAIAITIVWGIFNGPPSQRELLEWDQVYDDVDYQWSANGDPNMMDFENIATHELGHSVGLGDLYNSGCSAETMYGYADYGEINKRTLEAGDIAGVSTLY